MILSASASLHKILLTSQEGALSAKTTLIGLFLSMLFATNLKLELLVMTNSLLLKTLTNALSNSMPATMLAAVKKRNLASSS